MLENERLLVSLLPASGAAHVRDGNAEARQAFADVTVAYINLAGFDSMSPPLGDDDSMALLSDVVAACDEAAEHHGVEKVRTIGSSYLAVSGLSVERPDHTARMVEFAREVVRIVRRFNAERGVRLVAEIAINAGPVIGGLIGRRKFIYDLWGDTVKVAREIQSDGRTSILVTRPVYERVRELVVFGGPTRVEVSGVGLIRALLRARSRGGRGMNELLTLVGAQWPFALALVIGFPLVLVALTEAGFALARAGHPVAASVRFIRSWVVPLAGLVLFLRWVVLLPSTGLGVRLTESACWAVAIVATISVINNVVFESAAPGTWQRKVPRLLRDLLRLLLVAIGLATIYSFVWGREIEGALAALGVTSIVVGLALQEPLGNLFSGLMLLMERPFEVGETIEVGTVAGEVKEVNWRSAHIEAFGGSIMVVPNSTLNKETIVNFSRPRPHRMEIIDVAFSYQDPPYQVRQALTGLMREIDGILEKPSPIAATVGYGDYSVKYRLIYRTVEHDRWSVKNELVTRIWYMAQRHGFTMPYPVHVALQHQQERPFTPTAPESADLLAQFPRLPEMPPEDRARTRQLKIWRRRAALRRGRRSGRRLLRRLRRRLAADGQGPRSARDRDDSGRRVLR